MNINRDYISRNNINGTGNPCKYIVVHETDNYSRRANAKAHAKSQHDGNFADMSVHYYCGSDGVYQAAEHTCKCWHVGRLYVTSPNVPGCTNNNSLGVEICVNEDGDYEKARKNAIELVSYLIQRLQIPVSRVIRHYDAKGKYCPRKMMDNPSLWKDFKEQIADSLTVESGNSQTAHEEWNAVGTAVCGGDGVYYRPEPTTNCIPLGKLNRGNRFEVDGMVKDGWVHAKVVDAVCWIYGKYVIYDEPISDDGSGREESAVWKAVGTAICGGDGVRVRSTPEISDNILRKLYRGNRFEVDGVVENGFCHIKVEDVTGWMSSAYVIY